MGVIFCHVSKIKQLIQVKFFITSGNQKWKGAAPSFINKAESMIIIKNELIWGLKNSLNINIKITENNKIIEAIAWAIKYLIEDSEENIFLGALNRGIIDKRLISRPIHIPNHLIDEIEIKDPITRKLKNMIL